MWQKSVTTAKSRKRAYLFIVLLYQFFCWFETFKETFTVVRIGQAKNKRKTLQAGGTQGGSDRCEVERNELSKQLEARSQKTHSVEGLGYCPDRDFERF